MKCDCKDWQEKMESNKNYIVKVHGTYDYKKGLVIYCPFCGKKLKEEKREKDEKM